MENTYYSVEELSEILKLHPKTVRRFIREGRITGKKIGRSWMVHEEELKRYAHGELGGREGDSPDSLRVLPADPEGRPRITVSTVIELSEKDTQEASRISNSLLAMLNCRDPEWGEVRYDMMHDPEAHRGKFIFYGSPRFIAEIMKVFDIISRQEDGEEEK